jgi:hypothetical protein
MTPRILALLFFSVLVLGGVFAQGGEFPKGTYTATIKGDKWSIKFEPNGKFIFARKGKEVVEGSYKVKNDHVEFDDEKGSTPQVKGHTGVYKWKVDDKGLEFAKVEDHFKSRIKALTGQPWHKEK